jgi:hypothetical protein
LASDNQFAIKISWYFIKENWFFEFYFLSI